MPPLVIFGAGGLAREVAMVAVRLGRVPAAFVDLYGGRMLADIPVLDEAEVARRHAGADAVIAIGETLLRRRLAGTAAELGFACPALVDPATIAGASSHFEAGCIVLPGVCCTVDVRVGTHALLNPGVTLAHDVRVGAFASLSPGVHVAGNVAIGDDAFLGIGANVINGVPGRPLRIGAGAMVAAGAVVTRDIPPGQRVAGVPARPLSPKDKMP